MRTFARLPDIKRGPAVIRVQLGLAEATIPAIRTAAAGAASNAIVSATTAAAAVAASGGTADPHPFRPSGGALRRSQSRTPAQPCYDRKTRAVHGGRGRRTSIRGRSAARPWRRPSCSAIFDKTGVRFVNYFGIGQSLDMTSSCTYYLDCPGTSALPSIKNDFVNGAGSEDVPHPTT